MMNILLTNDDGVRAPGLWAAARVLAAFGRVTAVALGYVSVPPNGSHVSMGLALLSAPEMAEARGYPRPW